MTSHEEHTGASAELDYLDWIRGVASRRWTSGDVSRLGSAGHIDEAARFRGSDAIRRGRAVSVSRPLTEAPSSRGDGLPAFEMQTFFNDEPIGVYQSSAIAMVSEHVRLDSHGTANTHLDALNHTAVDGRWFDGTPTSEPCRSTMADLSRAGLVTRGIYVDVAGLRGEDWVADDRPPGGAELQLAIEDAGLRIEPGDALLVDMGRDRYEAAGHVMATPVRPGLGQSAARWLSDLPIGALFWDFLDAKHPTEPSAAVHLLNWATGLVLVDNCDFAAFRGSGRDPVRTCAVSVGPLAIAGASGVNVNPLVVW